MKRNVLSSAVITGGRPLCTQILPGQGCPPSTIVGTSKLETLGYSMVKTASLYILWFWNDTRVWQTDEQAEGQTGGYAVAYTTACKAGFSFAVHCKN